MTHPIMKYDKAAHFLARKIGRMFQCTDLESDIHQEVLITFWDIYRKRAQFGILPYMMHAGFVRGVQFIHVSRDPLGRVAGRRTAHAVTMEGWDEPVDAVGDDYVLAHEMMRAKVPDFDLVFRSVVMGETQLEIGNSIGLSKSRTCRRINTALAELQELV